MMKRQPSTIAPPTAKLSFLYREKEYFAASAQSVACFDKGDFVIRVPSDSVFFEPDPWVKSCVKKVYCHVDEYEI